MHLSGDVLVAVLGAWGQGDLGLAAGSPGTSFVGLGRALSEVAWLTCEILPLGTHKGHPYRSGRACE